MWATYYLPKVSAPAELTGLSVTRPLTSLMKQLSTLFLLVAAVLPDHLRANPDLANNLPEIAVVDDADWKAGSWISEHFNEGDWRDRWIVEGRAKVELENAMIQVDALDNGDREGENSTLWRREPLPADVLIEVIARVEPPALKNAANVNLILHAREPGGSPYLFGRNGTYPEYQKFPNYIMTFTGGTQQGWARLRRNPGFELLHEVPTMRTEVGRTYRLRVMITGGRIRQWIDGQLIHDFNDAKPLPGGAFGLRTWRTRITWMAFRFTSLRRTEAPAKD